VVITVFPEDVYRFPETWAWRVYRKLISFREVGKGGHFGSAGANAQKPTVSPQTEVPDGLSFRL